MEELENNDVITELETVPIETDDIYSKFLLTEYNTLNKQLEKLLSETDNLAKYALLGTVSVWAWFAIHQEVYTQNKFLLWLPMGFCFLLGLRSLILTNLIVEIGGFIAGIEEALGASEDLGWELYVRKQRGKGNEGISTKEQQRKTKKLKGHVSGRFISAVIFWVLLLLATIFIPMAFKNIDPKVAKNQAVSKPVE